MKRLSWAGVLSFVLIGVCANAAQHVADSEEAVRADAARAMVEQEIKKLGAHPWAGYYTDSVVNLWIAPGAGFAYEVHGCMGIYDRNYGKVSVSGGKLQFQSVLPIENMFGATVAPGLIPVVWGSRAYLITSDDMIDFCNSVNRGFEPREGSCGCYLLRHADANLPANEMPAVPDEYKRYLLKTPIQAKVISVGETEPFREYGMRNYRTRLVVDVGSKQGLLAGMELAPIQPDNAYGDLTVLSVKDGQAEAEFVGYSRRPKPSAGWVFSTRPYSIE
ncbi:MAG: hypothetical protein WC655_21740 [Candidatus Hydrogenedentales bacterium]|jgi:hypothetical protein